MQSVGLKKGDIVDIVAPGWSLTNKEFAAAVKTLKSWGLIPRFDKEIFGKDYLCSNTASYRGKNLIKALKAMDSKAIWCMRGGYGAIHLLPALKKIKPVKQSKVFIGYSDVTSLHIFLQKNWGWPTIHGPLLDRLAKESIEKKYLKEIHDLIFSNNSEITFKKLKSLNTAAKNIKQKTKESNTISGEVIGGNLVVASSTIGTPYEINTDGKIIFFEEVGERGYRIDRLLYQFEQAGLFKKAKAVVFGQFTSCVEPNGRSITKSILKEFASRMTIPVLSGIESGHGQNQRPVPFGTKSILNLKTKELICSSGII